MADLNTQNTSTRTVDHAPQTMHSELSPSSDLEAQSSPFPPLEVIPEDGHVQIVDLPRDSKHSLDKGVSPFSKRSNTGLSHASVKSQRRRGQTSASKYGPEHITGPGSAWQPGLEPGIDPSELASCLEPNSHLDVLHLKDLKNNHCEITIVDFSQQKMEMYELENDELEAFVRQPKADWVTCRWINVNGLSGDVISVLATHKGLHRLAVEDLTVTTNRSKVDWYNDHTFIIIALQKLEKLVDSDDSEDSSEDEKPHRRRFRRRAKEDDEKSSRRSRKRRHGVIWDFWNDILTHRKKKRRAPNPNELSSAKALATAHPDVSTHHARTLQRFHAGANKDRVDYMERHGILKPLNYKVIMEQVSMFLTDDNTVVSFFEASAKAIEDPIVRRLKLPETILRQSCDASMVLQAIIDAIVDLAVEVSGAYQDALGGLELDVLTDPDISQAKRLYILTSEVSVLRNAVQPIASVLTSLKEHRSKNRTTSFGVGTSTADLADKQQTSGVTITPLTRIYLSDVEDNCILVTDSYEQMRHSADNLVDLIFNTIGAYQNESMRQLTLVTCLFLPLTFLAGYFGMNFEEFPTLKNNADQYFWTIAIPATVATMLFLMRDKILRWMLRQVDLGLITRGRKRRKDE